MVFPELLQSKKKIEKVSKVAINMTNIIKNIYGYILTINILKVSTINRDRMMGYIDTMKYLAIYPCLLSLLATGNCWIVLRV